MFVFLVQNDEINSLETWDTLPNYTLRAHQLKHLNLYFYISEYDVIKSTDVNKANLYKFLDSHPKVC